MERPRCEFCDAAETAPVRDPLLYARSRRLSDRGGTDHRSERRLVAHALAIEHSVTAEFGFREGFLWGTATAAHQIEGGNVNNDWWEWEHNPDSGCAESSGDACDSFHRWPE